QGCAWRASAGEANSASSWSRKKSAADLSDIFVAPRVRRRVVTGYQCSKQAECHRAWADFDRQNYSRWASGAIRAKCGLVALWQSVTAQVRIGPRMRSGRQSVGTGCAATWEWPAKRRSFA